MNLFRMKFFATNALKIFSDLKPILITILTQLLNVNSLDTKIYFTSGIDIIFIERKG